MYVETGRYLRQMIRDVQIAGGKIEVRRFATPGRHRGAAGEPGLQLHRASAAATCSATRSCSPARGQLAILEPQPEVRYAFTGGPGYMFPRPDGIILGGTFELDQWDATPQPAAIARILAVAQALLRRLPLHRLKCPRAASDIAGEMNYHSSIPQSGGEQARSAEGQAHAQGDRRRAQRAYRRPGRRQAARSRSRCATAGAASSSAPSCATR